MRTIWFGNGHFTVFCSFPDPNVFPELHAIWVESVGKHSPIKFVPSKGSRLCSKHFSKDMIEEDRMRVILKPNAVPSIYHNVEVCAFELYYLLEK